jgi:hypothetical protein
MGVDFRIRIRDNLGRVPKLVITIAENVVMQTCPKHWSLDHKLVLYPVLS